MLSLPLLLTLLACGAVAGFLAGLLGVGGGLVIVPVVLGSCPPRIWAATMHSIWRWAPRWR